MDPKPPTVLEQLAAAFFASLAAEFRGWYRPRRRYRTLVVTAWEGRPTAIAAARRTGVLVVLLGVTGHAAGVELVERALAKRGN